MGILDDLRHKAEELGEKAKEGLDAARDKAGDLVDDVRERFGQHEGEHAPTGESSDVGPDSSSTDAVQPGYVTGEDEAAGSGDDSLSDETDDSGPETSTDTDTDTDVGTDVGSGPGQAQGAVDSVGAVDPVVAAEAEAGQDDATTGSGSVGEEVSADLGTEVDGSSSVADGTDGAATTETDGADLVDPQDTGAGETPSTTDLLDSGTGDADGSYAPDDAVGTAEVGDQGDAPAPDDAPLEPVATDVDPYAEPLTEPIGQEIALDDVDPETLARAVEDTSPERGS